MIQRTRIFLSVVMIVVVFASLGMVNHTSVEAAPKPTATPTFTPAPPLPPGNYYVSVSGNDANPGTFAAPWRVEPHSGLPWWWLPVTDWRANSHGQFHHQETAGHRREVAASRREPFR